jgi:hypothetical protein
MIGEFENLTTVVDFGIVEDKDGEGTRISTALR